MTGEELPHCIPHYTLLAEVSVRLLLLFSGFCLRERNLCEEPLDFLSRMRENHVVVTMVIDNHVVVTMAI